MAPAEIGPGMRGPLCIGRRAVASTQTNLKAFVCSPGDEPAAALQ